MSAKPEESTKLTGKIASKILQMRSLQIYFLDGRDLAFDTKITSLNDLLEDPFFNDPTLLNEILQGILARLEDEELEKLKEQIKKLTKRELDPQNIRPVIAKKGAEKALNDIKQNIPETEEPDLFMIHFFATLAVLWVKGGKIWAELTD